MARADPNLAQRTLGQRTISHVRAEQAMKILLTAGSEKGFSSSEIFFLNYLRARV